MTKNAMRRGLTFAGISAAIIVVFVLVQEHWAHAGGYLPYLILLACPLMHLFHGHGGHAAHDASSTPKT